MVVWSRQFGNSYYNDNGWLLGVNMGAKKGGVPGAGACHQPPKSPCLMVTFGGVAHRNSKDFVLIYVARHLCYSLELCSS